MGAAMPDHISCDGFLKVAFPQSSAADCNGSFSAKQVANAPMVSIGYPYFTELLYYSVLAVERGSRRLLWLVCKVQGTTLNAGSDFVNQGHDAMVLAPYEAPLAGSKVLLLVYVQPT